MLILADYILENIPGWIKAGMDVYELYVKTQAVIDANKGPGADDWNALDDKAKALQSIVRDTSKDSGTDPAVTS